MKALLLNDNPAVSKLVGLSLQKLGIQFEETADAGSINPVDLLIIDGSFGISDAQALELSPRVIRLMSRADMPEDGTRGINYLAKPFLPTDFNELAQSLLAGGSAYADELDTAVDAGSSSDELLADIGAELAELDDLLAENKGLQGAGLLAGSDGDLDDVFGDFDDFAEPAELGAIEAEQGVDLEQDVLESAQDAELGALDDDNHSEKDAQVPESASDELEDIEDDFSNLLEEEPLNTPTEPDKELSELVDDEIAALDDTSAEDEPLLDDVELADDEHSVQSVDEQAPADVDDKLADDLLEFDDEELTNFGDLGEIGGELEDGGFDETDEPKGSKIDDALADDMDDLAALEEDLDEIEDEPESDAALDEQNDEQNSDAAELDDGLDELLDGLELDDAVGSVASSDIADEVDESLDFDMEDEADMADEASDIELPQISPLENENEDGLLDDIDEMLSMQQVDAIDGADDADADEAAQLFEEDESIEDSNGEATMDIGSSDAANAEIYDDAAIETNFAALIESDLPESFAELKEDFKDILNDNDELSSDELELADSMQEIGGIEHVDFDGEVDACGEASEEANVDCEQNVIEADELAELEAVDVAQMKQMFDETTADEDQLIADETSGEDVAQDALMDSECEFEPEEANVNVVDRPDETEMNFTNEPEVAEKLPVESTEQFEGQDESSECNVCISSELSNIDLQDMMQIDVLTGLKDASEVEAMFAAKSDIEQLVDAAEASAQPNLQNIEINSEDNIDEVSAHVSKALSEAMSNSAKASHGRIKDISINININFKD